MGEFELKKYKDPKDLWLFAKNNGVEQTAILLRLYVLAGQPDGFCDDCTTRAMCWWASLGCEGKDYDDKNVLTCYLSTKYGPYFYWKMWGGFETPEQKERTTKALIDAYEGKWQMVK